MKAKRILFLTLLTACTLFTGCVTDPTTGQSRFDVVALTRNPVFVLIVGGVILWFMFRKK